MGKDQLHKSFSRKGIFKSWVAWGILASLFERAIKMEETPFSEVVKFELMSQTELWDPKIPLPFSVANNNFILHCLLILISHCLPHLRLWAFSLDHKLAHFF